MPRNSKVGRCVRKVSAKGHGKVSAMGPQLTISQLKVRPPQLGEKRTRYDVSLYQNETSWVAVVVTDGACMPVRTKRGQTKAYRTLDTVVTDLRRAFGEEAEFSLNIAPTAVTSLDDLMSHLKQK